MIPRVNVDVDANTRSFETVLPEPKVTTRQEAVQSFVKRVRATHTLQNANKDEIGIDVDSDIVAIDCKPQTQSESVFKPQSDTRVETECTIPNIVVVTRKKVKTTVKLCSTKCIKTLQSPIVKVT